MTAPCMLATSAASLVLLVSPARSQQPTVDAVRARAVARLAERESAFIAFRRDLHQHPEPSGSEERTAAAVATALRALGLEVRTSIGGHGVVAILRGARPGPLVAFRADMDAMPSAAPDPVDFASLTPGVRHICGHDIHTTIGVAIAEGLAAVRNDVAGSVMLIFQPAEERATGARAMLAGGVFASERPDAIYAVHTSPLAVGTLGTRPGVLLGGRDGIRVVLSGDGNLEAAADTVRRLLERVGTLTMAQAFQPSGEDFLLVQAGPPRRAGPTRMVVEAVIAAASPAAGARARDAMLGSLGGLVVPSVTVEPQYAQRIVAGVTNDGALATLADRSIGTELGPQAVVPVTGVVPAFSEDFGLFQDSVPGVMYFLGVANAERGWRGMPHSPDYVADEASILIGARAMTAVILDRLSARRPAP